MKKNLKKTLTVLTLVFVALFAAICFTACNNQNNDSEVTGLILNRNYITMKKGETQQIIATVTGGNGTRPVKYFSGNEAVAIVSDSGVVKAIDLGETVIVAHCNDYRALCYIVVNEDETGVKQTVSKSGSVYLSANLPLASISGTYYSPLNLTYNLKDSMLDLNDIKLNINIPITKGLASTKTVGEETVEITAEEQTKNNLELVKQILTLNENMLISFFPIDFNYSYCELGRKFSEEFDKVNVPEEQLADALKTVASHEFIFNNLEQVRSVAVTGNGLLEAFNSWDITKSSTFETIETILRVVKTIDFKTSTFTELDWVTILNNITDEDVTKEINPTLAKVAGAIAEALKTLIGGTDITRASAEDGQDTLFTISLNETGKTNLSSFLQDLLISVIPEEYQEFLLGLFGNAQSTGFNIKTARTYINLYRDQATGYTRLGKFGLTIDLSLFDAIQFDLDLAVDLGKEIVSEEANFFTRTEQKVAEMENDIEVYDRFVKYVGMTVPINNSFPDKNNKKIDLTQSGRAAATEILDSYDGFSANVKHLIGTRFDKAVSIETLNQAYTMFDNAVADSANAQTNEEFADCIGTVLTQNITFTEAIKEHADRFARIREMQLEDLTNIDTAIKDICTELQAAINSEDQAMLKTALRNYEELMKYDGKIYLIYDYSGKNAQYGDNILLDDELKALRAKICDYKLKSADDGSDAACLYTAAHLAMRAALKYIRNILGNEDFFEAVKEIEQAYNEDIFRIALYAYGKNGFSTALYRKEWIEMTGSLTYSYRSKVNTLWNNVWDELLQAYSDMKTNPGDESYGNWATLYNKYNPVVNNLESAENAVFDYAISTLDGVKLILENGQKVYTDNTGDIE